MEKLLDHRFLTRLGNLRTLVSLAGAAALVLIGVTLAVIKLFTGAGWIPLLFVIFYALGADVWVRNPAVVGWNVLSGFVCLGIFYGIVRWAWRPGSERFAERLEESSAGRAVHRAQSVLDEIERFERE